MNVDLLPIPLLRTGKVQVRDFTLDEMLAYARANVAADRAQRQAEQAVYKVGCLLTVNDDPYPALPGLFGQLWDGEVVAARVYGNSREEVNERVAALNVAVPQAAAAPDGCKLVPLEPTPEMLASYLEANDAYWHRTDVLPTANPGKWRNGTPSEATAESYRAMLAAAPDA